MVYHRNQRMFTHRRSTRRAQLLLVVLGEIIMAVAWRRGSGGRCSFAMPVRAPSFEFSVLQQDVSDKPGNETSASRESVNSFDDDLLRELQGEE